MPMPKIRLTSRNRRMYTLARKLHYLSTYCLHGLHDQCRITCKHCPEMCWCLICDHKE